ncbi:hypothetical protein A4X03_0g6988 [Tilletia caries]|uniref:Uncharacterized protein n=3 Tax=Tilletia TaxID=13289 RepID=A0A177UC88_9BASI|nr:hypothetical protein A4X03_0g6988 [Tilletia caries]
MERGCFLPDGAIRSIDARCSGTTSTITASPASGNMARTKGKAARKADLDLRKDALKKGPASNPPIDAATGPSAPGPSAASSSFSGPRGHEMGHDPNGEHQGSGEGSEDHSQAANTSTSSAPGPRVCSVCGTQTRPRLCKTPRGKMLFCKTHDVRYTMVEKKAMSHFSHYRGFGGNLTPVDLAKAEIEGKLTIQYQDQTFAGGSPTTKIYFVKELYDLSHSKQRKATEDPQADRARKQEAARNKRAQRLADRNKRKEERKAQKAQNQEERKAQKAAAAAASQQAQHAPHPENSADLTLPSSSPINEAGPSSSVTVSSAYIMDVSDDVGDVHNAATLQLSPSSIASADPRPVPQDFRIKAEPGLEPPMLSSSAGMSALSGTAVQSKREADQSLFLPDDF